MIKNNKKLIKMIRKVGDDVFISKKVEIKHLNHIKIGNHVAIDSGFKCTTKISIGDYIHISPDVTIIGGINSSLILEDFTFIAAGTKVVCGSENYVRGGLVGATIPSKYRNLIYSEVVFKKYSGVGVNCSILPGVILGEGSVVGANSLVTRSTKPWHVYVGSPAKSIKVREKSTIMKYTSELGYE